MVECLSCKKNTLENVKFPCPICKREINRCSKCRGLSIEYKCPKCGYIGP